MPRQSKAAKTLQETQAVMVPMPVIAPFARSVTPPKERAEGQSLDAVETLNAVHDTLVECLTLARAKISEGKNPFAAIARISESLVRIAGEARQQSKQKKRDLKRFSVDDIVDHLKSLPIEAQERLVKELTGSDIASPLL